MEEQEKEQMIQNLYELFVQIGSVEDCRILLDDLCTNKEVEQMAQRLKAAQLLKQGHTYTQVIEMTDISSATLSRVSRCLKYGKGYRKFVHGEQD